MLIDALQKLSQLKNLSKTECCDALKDMLRCENSLQIAAFLTLLHAKEETSDELLAFVETFQQQMTTINNLKPALDVVGTGGDGKNTVNISSATSLACASLGVPTLKHGNRSVSSKSGSADFFEKLGIPLTAEADLIAQSLESMNFAFLFAQAFHPALKKFASIRSDLKLRTTFNLIGPLLNPASPRFYLMGVYKEKLLPLFAEVLCNQSIERALIVHSCGMDEMSLMGETKLIEVNNNYSKAYSIEPKQVGLAKCSLEDIQGGDAATNVSLIMEAFAGSSSAIQDTIILNTGAALYAAKRADSIEQGVDMAREHLKQGHVANYIQTLSDFYAKSK